jgi:CheY-like chemotaxis protein
MVKTGDRGLKVLVMEDEAVIALLLCEVLTGMGYRDCAIAATEADAVASAARRRPDLMIADARLRVGSGVAAVLSILRDGFVPHVFVSGDRLDPDVLSPRAVLLRKPFVESELVAAIERALGKLPVA